MASLFQRLTLSNFHQGTKSRQGTKSTRVLWSYQTLPCEQYDIGSHIRKSCLKSARQSGAQTWPCTWGQLDATPEFTRYQVLGEGVWAPPPRVLLDGETTTGAATLARPESQCSQACDSFRTLEMSANGSFLSFFFSFSLSEDEVGTS